jgi:3'-phosphoadenosine 5'-phosphosulfate sulfotransferase (PAPS reductase)/FAD synthetase
MKVNLKWYDWIVANTSAGKDSQASLDVVVRRAEAAGVKARVVAVHCELPEEWPGTTELAREQAARYGVRFEVVRRRKGGLLDRVLDRHASLVGRGKADTPPWPSSTSRWCTSELKRGPVAALFTRLAQETRAARGKGRRVRILNCLGLRAAESCAREKLLPFRLDKANTNGRRVVHTWLPVFGFTAGMVWSRVRYAGTPVHPAYSLGMPRLSCVFCIFSPRNALLLAGKHNRDLLDRYVEVERQVGFAFRKGLPLADIRDALDRGEEPGPVTSWEVP